MSLIKKGIIASEQIAIGKVKLMKKQEVKISSEKISDDEIKLHVDKFEKALNDYKTILSETKVDNDTQKQVIEAHLSMLDDPFLSESVISKINEHYSSDKALTDTIDEMVVMMQKEVADRISAIPRPKDRGPVSWQSVHCRLCAHCR